ncbi:MAG: acyltransferase family protein [Maribacter stanieri]
MKNSTKKNNLIISGYSSIFLDSLRLLSALVVVFVHANDQWITESNNGYDIGHLGHTAVIVFFVLSGFVISFTCRTKNRGWKQYLQARLSRLYSILFPALIFSALIEIIISNLDLSILSEYTRGASWPRYIFTLFFVSESGFFSVAPPINRPLWSLSYEFWYYIIFGLYFFLKKGWRTYLLILVACLIAGPKIIIMMPIWLAGSYAYVRHRELKNIKLAWLLVSISVCISVLLSFVLPSKPYTLGQEPMFYSNQFLTDYAIGLILTIGLIILPLGKSNMSVNRFVPTFRKLGDLTFPIYVLHHPMLILWRTLFGFEPNNKADMWIAIIFILIISSSLGLLLEKQRYIYNNLFKWGVNLFSLRNRIV